MELISSIQCLVSDDPSYHRSDQHGQQRQKTQLIFSSLTRTWRGVSVKQTLKTAPIRHWIAAENVNIPAFFPKESSVPLLMTAANVQHFSLQRALLDLHSSLYSSHIANGSFPLSAHWNGSPWKGPVPMARWQRHAQLHLAALRFQRLHKLPNSKGNSHPPTPTAVSTSASNQCQAFLFSSAHDTKGPWLAPAGPHW